MFPAIVFKCFFFVGELMLGDCFFLGFVEMLNILMFLNFYNFGCFVISFWDLFCVFTVLCLFFVFGVDFVYDFEKYFAVKKL